ncbi:MAG TPA: YolD-like family protein [Bacillus sp. (in: firmicutes)]|nr:YolD-like family protein [Bacillus sp. (in: firmicutes)]
MSKLNERNMVKWQPFLLPEHRFLLENLRKEDTKVEMPIIDRQQLEKFTETICDAMAFDQALAITFHHNNRMELVVCHIHYFDTYNQELRAFDKFNNICRIRTDKIVDVQIAEDF